MDAATGEKRGTTTAGSTIETRNTANAAKETVTRASGPTIASVDGAIRQGETTITVGDQWTGTGSRIGGGTDGAGSSAGSGKQTEEKKIAVSGEASLDTSFAKGISESGIIAKLTPKHDSRFDVAIVTNEPKDMQDAIVVGGTVPPSYGEDAPSADMSLSLSVAQCITPSGAACVPDFKDAGLNSGDIFYTNKTLSRTNGEGKPELIQLGFVTDKDMTKYGAVYQKLAWDNGTFKSAGINYVPMGLSTLKMGLGTKDGKLVLLGTVSIDKMETPNVIVHTETAAGKNLCSFSSSFLYSESSGTVPFWEEPLALREEGDGKIVIAAYREDHAEPYPYNPSLVWYRIMPESGCNVDNKFGNKGAIVTPLPSDLIGVAASTFDKAGRLVLVADYETNNGFSTTYKSVILRYLPTGKLDESFGYKGVVQMPGTVRLTALVFDGANNIIVGGSMKTKEIADKDFQDNFGKGSFLLKEHKYDLDFYVARFTESGGADLGFAPLLKNFITINFPGSYFDEVTGLALDSQDRIVVTGSTTYYKVVWKKNPLDPLGNKDTMLEYNSGVGIVRLGMKSATAPTDGTAKPGDTTAGEEPKKDENIKVITVKRDTNVIETRSVKSVLDDKRAEVKAARVAERNAKKEGDTSKGNIKEQPVANKTVADRTLEEKENRLEKLMNISVGREVGKRAEEEVKKKEAKKGEHESETAQKENEKRGAAKEKCWQPLSPDGSKLISLADPGCRCWKVVQKGGKYSVDVDPDCKDGKKYTGDQEPALDQWAVTSEPAPEEEAAKAESAKEAQEKCWMPSTFSAVPDIVPIPDQKCRCWFVFKNDAGSPTIALDDECKKGKKLVGDKPPDSAEWIVAMDASAFVAGTETGSGEKATTETKKEKCWSPTTPDGGKTILATVDPKCQCWSLKKTPGGQMTPELDAECKVGKKITALETPQTTAWVEDAATSSGGEATGSIGESGSAAKGVLSLAQLLASAPAGAPSTELLATDAVNAAGEVEIVSYEAPATPLPADAIYVSPTTVAAAADAGAAAKAGAGDTGKSSSSAEGEASSGGGGGGGGGGCSLIRN